MFLLISVPLTTHLGFTNTWILSDFVSCRIHIYLAHVSLVGNFLFSLKKLIIKFIIIHVPGRFFCVIQIEKYIYRLSCKFESLMRRKKWHPTFFFFFISFMTLFFYEYNAYLSEQEPVQPGKTTTFPIFNGIYVKRERNT